MVALTGTIFKALINDATISATNAEYIIDAAISNINLYSKADLPLMGGAAGSKTVSLESDQYAAVLIAARAIYNGFYQGIDVPTIGGLSVTTPDVASNPAVLSEIRRAARQLAELDVSYG